MALTVVFRLWNKGFDFGKNELKEEGKALLNAFIPVYIRTLMSEENEGYVGEIIIEGHTDTDGTYERNLELSQANIKGKTLQISSEQCKLL